MYILGIDPALHSIGWGLIAKQNNSFLYVNSGTLIIAKTLDLPIKLKQIFNNMNLLIKAQPLPQLVSLEEVFINKNPKASLNLAYARACIILSLTENNLPLTEVSATKVKLYVGGNGHINKEDLWLFTKKILTWPNNTPINITSLDQSDALAIALTAGLLV